MVPVPDRDEGRLRFPRRADLLATTCGCKVRSPPILVECPRLPGNEPMPQKKSSTTLLFNFLIPGTGHLYASGGEKWGLFVGHLVCAFTGAFLILPWVGNVIIWLIAMVDSSSVTAMYNIRHDDQVEEAVRHQAAAAQAKSEAKAKAIARTEAEETARAREATIDSRQLDGEALAQKFARLSVLASTGVMDADEISSEHRKIISSSLTGWTDQDIATFLGPFAQLLSQGMIDDSILKSVKTVYSAIPKSRPQ